MSDRGLGRITSVQGAKGKARIGREVLAAFADAEAGPDRQARVGDLVRLSTPRSRVFGIVNGISVTEDGDDGTPRAGELEIDLIGEVLDRGGDGASPIFHRGISVAPALGAEVVLADEADVETVYARMGTDSIRIGSIYQASGVPAHLIVDDLLTKHFAILGTTGSGKSCAAALILRAILDSCPHGHVIMLDPHDEYAEAFGDRAECIDTETLHLPYWLLNFEELKAILVSNTAETRESEARILADVLLKVKKEHPENDGLGWYVTVDTPVPYRIGALKKAISDEMGTLNKADRATPYFRLMSRIDNLTSDRRYAFMFSSRTVRDLLPEILTRILRIPVDGRPITIMNLSGLPGEITDVVVSVLCRVVFDFALWSEKRQRIPLLLVCEEAHRYIPDRSDTGFEPTKNSIAQIAKEGRKYGVSLGLISQRPSELSTSILSQCGTLIALRMSNEQDLGYVRAALGEGPSGLLAVLPACGAQEAVVVGEGVRVPMRIRLDDLAPENRPRSDSASFYSQWQTDDSDAGLVGQAIESWRKQSRRSTDAADPDGAD